MEKINAFVTGGSRGIGRTIVHKLISEGYGCAFTYFTNQDGGEETIAQAKATVPDAQIMAYKMDVKDHVSVERCVEQAIDTFGSIGVVINNAAVVRNNAAAIMTNDEWNEVIATNLSGPFYVIRSFLIHMLANHFGRIVNISSIAQDGASGQINYAASKAGLVGMTRTLAREYGIKGITCNAVTVGAVETDMTKTHMTNVLRDIWLQYCPMKRLGTPEEIASLVHYLTTESAGFINGEIIRVCGGLTYAP